MKIKSLLTVGLLFCISYSYGQFNILNAKHPDEIGKKTKQEIKQGNQDEPLPYGYTNDRDVLWGKEVWEYIDLKQKANFPYLYPIDTGRVGSQRMSLFHVLMKNIKNGTIKHIYADSYFRRKRTLEELQATLHRVDTLPAGIRQLNAGEEIDRQFISHTDVNGNDVQGFRIRGLWYFDKRNGDLRYRLIGICPMVTGAYAKKNNVENAPPVGLFWVFYPEVRKVLFKTPVFNPNNSAHPFNYDELLNARRFSAVIYKADNVHGDRTVKDYVGDNSLKQLLESRRIKNQIRDFEVNMWNY